MPTHESQPSRIDATRRNEGLYEQSNAAEGRAAREVPDARKLALQLVCMFPAIATRLDQDSRSILTDFCIEPSLKSIDERQASAELQLILQQLSRDAYRREMEVLQAKIVAGKADGISKARYSWLFKEVQQRSREGEPKGGSIFYD